MLAIIALWGFTLIGGVQNATSIYGRGGRKSVATSLVQMKGAAALAMAPAVLPMVKDGMQEVVGGVKNIFRKPQSPPPACGSRGGIPAQVKCSKEKFDDLTSNIYPMYLGIFKSSSNMSESSSEVINKYYKLAAEINAVRANMLGSVDDSDGGLQAQAKLLGKASNAIELFEIKAESFMHGQLKSLQAATSNAVKSMGNNVSLMFDTIQAGINKAKNLQDVNAQKNAAFLVRIGQADLTFSANNLTGNQGDITTKLANASDSLLNAATNTDTSLSVVSVSLRRASLALESAPRALASTFGSHAQVVTNQISNSQDRLSTVSQSAGEVASSQASSASETFISSGAVELSHAGAKWSSAQSSTQSQVDTAIRSTNARIQKKLDILGSSVSGDSSGARAAVGKAQIHVGTGLADITDSHQGLGGDARGLSSSLQDLAFQVYDSTSTAGDTASARASDAKTAVARQLGAAGTTKAKELQSLSTSVSALQSKAYRQVSRGGQAVSDQITALYNGLGSTASQTSQAVASTQGLLLTGKSQTLSRISTLTATSLSVGEKAASTFLGELYETGSTAKNISRFTSSTGKNIADDKKTAAIGILRNVKNILASSQNAVTMRSLDTQAVLRASGDSRTAKLGRAWYSADKLNSAIDSQIGQQDTYNGVIGDSATNEVSRTFQIARQISENTRRQSETLSLNGQRIQRDTASTYRYEASTADDDVKRIIKAAVDSLKASDASFSKDATDTEVGQATASSHIASLSVQAEGFECDLLKTKENVRSADLAIKSNFQDGLQHQSLASAQKAHSQQKWVMDGLMGMQASTQRDAAASSGEMLSTSVQNLMAKQTMLSKAVNGNSALQAMLSRATDIVNQKSPLRQAQLTPLDSSLSNLQIHSKDHAQSVPRKVSALLARLNQWQTDAETSLTRMKSLVEALISAIPGKIQGGATLAMSQLSSAETDIRAKIRSLQSKVAQSTGKEQTAAAQIALNVLYRLQAVSDMSRKSNEIMLDQIADGNEIDASQLTSIKTSAQSISQAVSDINSNMQSEMSGVRGSADYEVMRMWKIFQATSTDLEHSVSRLSANATNGQTDTLFDFAAAQNGIKRHIAGSTLRLTFMSNLSSSHADALVASEQRVSLGIHSITEALRSLAASFAEWFELFQSTCRSLSAPFNRVSGSLGRRQLAEISTVNNAMGAFIDLWMEYAPVALLKLEGFNKKSKEDISLLNAQLKQRVKRAKEKLDSVGFVGSTQAFNTELTDAEDDFEARLISGTGALAAIERNLHTKLNEVITTTREDVLEFERSAIQENINLRNQVKRGLKSFDNSLGRLHEA